MNRSISRDAGDGSTAARFIRGSLFVIGFAACSLAANAGQLPPTAFQTYNATNASSIVPGPFALYSVPVGSIAPTQMNVGFSEIGKKTSGFDLLAPSALTSTLLTDIEPVVIGPGGQLYLTNGHHTFLALSKSVHGAANPNVFVDVIANYSQLTPVQFWAQMQASNFLLSLDGGVVQSIDPNTGAPIPTSLAGMANDVYRGLEYSILKNSNSVLFPTAANITSSIGSSKPGLDKTAAYYSDFIWAQAYRSSNGGLGLPHRSPADIALSTQWNLDGGNAVALTGTSVAKVAQLPGYILPSGGSLNVSSTISDATLANGVLAGDGSFTGLRGQHLGTVTIGSTAPGFIMQLGADLGGSVTLSGANTYTGGTTILAGTLNVTSDASFGAASPTGAVIDPHDIASSVQANNGIVFNSLSEGAGALNFNLSTPGTLAAPFVLNRPIAINGEVATLNPGGNVVQLSGEIISLGGGGTGIGKATGFSDVTLNGNGTAILAPTNGSNPAFYGNWIVTKGTLQASSDAALGNINGPSYALGQIDLDGGTFQAGASFNSARTLAVTSKSTFDTNGFTTSFGQFVDTARNLTFSNSRAGTSGAVSFGSADINAAFELTLDKGNGNGTSVTFTNDIGRGPNATLLLTAATGSTLGSTAKVLSSGASATLSNGIVPPWILTDAGSSANNAYDFATYGANGYVAASYSTNINPTNATSVVKPADKAGTLALTANRAFHALNLTRGTTLNGNSYTLSIGDGSSPAGFIMNGTNGNPLTVNVGQLAFGGSEGIVYTGGSQTSAVANVINAPISGSGGLTLSGSGMLTLSQAATQTGTVVIDSGTLNLAVANALQTSAGVSLQNTKNLATANLAFNQSQTFASLNSAGSNSTILIDATGTNGGSASTRLTIGDAGNASSTLSSAIVQAPATQSAGPTTSPTGNAVAGVLTKNGSGMLDLAGMSRGTLDLVAGSTVVVNGGILRLAAKAFLNPNGIVLNNASEVQFAEDGGSVLANAVTGNGTLHLIGGILQLTSAANTYTGGTQVEAGSTLDLTTANVSSGNANIADAGGLIVFDQATSGSYAGVISDGRQMGSGAFAPGNLVKDDSSGSNSGNVTLAAAQTYTGGTFVEAGTLTLGVADAVAASSGVVLGRIGGPTASGAAPANGAPTAVLALGADNSIQGLTSEAGNNTQVQLGSNTLTLAPFANGTGVFGGEISGAGALVKRGAGRQTLSGVNTYTGTTTVSGGVLALAGNGAIAASGKLTNDAGFDLSATTGGATITSLAGNASGSVILGAQTLTLSGAGDTFAGVISGTGGLAITGGSATLSGINTYSGATSISSGAVLQLDGGIASASTLVSGTLRGTGAVNGSVEIASGGVVHPGDAAGDIATLHVGALTLDIGATAAFDLGTSAGSNDRVVGSGAIAVASGAHIAINLAATPATGTYILITGTSISGTLPAPTFSPALPSALVASLTSDGTSITLKISSTTAVALQSSLNPSSIGQTVTFTATVTGSSPTGSVAFYDGADLLGSGSLNSGVGTLTTSSLTLGAHTITAVYGGDANHAGSTSAALQQQVNARVTTTSLGSSANPSAFGQSVAFTATVTGSTPTGSVSFYDGATPIGSANLSGSIAVLGTSNLAVGPHAITAVYSGDDNNTGSTSNVVAQQVNASSSTTTLSSSANPSTFGQSVTLSAAVTGQSPTGSVSFLDGTTTLCASVTIDGGIATCSAAALTPGTHSITARYAGDTNNADSTSPVLTQTVNRAATTTTLSTACDTTFVSGQPFTFSAGVKGGANITGSITFSSAGLTLCSNVPLSGSGASCTTEALTVSGATTQHTYDVRATYNGDSHYLSSVSAMLPVTVLNPVDVVFRNGFEEDTSECPIE
jgi:autotransporter-associated beta strand protein